MEELRRNHEADVRLFYASLIGIFGGVVVGSVLTVAQALLVAG